MAETIVSVNMPDGTIREYIFTTPPTAEQMNSAMKTIGGREKRP